MQICINNNRNTSWEKCRSNLGILQATGLGYDGENIYRLNDPADSEWLIDTLMEPVLVCSRYVSIHLGQ